MKKDKIHKWDESYVFKAYDLARAGFTRRKIMQGLGVSHITFVKWLKSKPAFAKAIESGKFTGHNSRGQVQSFREFVFQRLPANLRAYWLQLNKLDKKSTPTEQLDAMFEHCGKTVRQHLFFYAWSVGNFSINQALSKVGISRSTFDKWRREDDEFKALVNEFNFYKKNFFEDALCTLVACGDAPATIFANKTFNKDRGYNEKIDVNMSGDLNQNVVTVDSLNLPLDIRKQLLEAIRNRQKDIKEQVIEEGEQWHRD